MLKRFALRNFKNFANDICVDFSDVAGYKFNEDCIGDGIISKMLIYGQNATGKTNLGFALINLTYMLLDGPSMVQPISNANHASDTTLFSYIFLIDDKEIEYEYRKKSDNSLAYEKMRVSGRDVYICDYVENTIIISNLLSLGLESSDIITDRYEEVMKEDSLDNEEPSRKCFLKWLIGNTAYSSDSVIKKLASEIAKMKFINVSSPAAIRFRSMYDGFYDYLSDEDNLKHFELFLNNMGIECTLEIRKLPDGNMELYFAYDTLVPFFPNASSGTRALVDLYRRLIFNGARGASLLYLDEFDAFYHFEMSERVLSYLKESFPDTQIIITTHNTNLMTNRIMRPDCLFILSKAGILTPLCKATSRELREGHNLEKLYQSGEFGS